MLRLFAGFCLLLAAGPMCGQSARIEDIGIHGHYRFGIPVSVRVQLANPIAQPIAVALQFRLESGHSGTLTDVFSQSVTMPANSQVELDVPLVFRNTYMGNGYGRFLVLEARSPAGLFAYDKRDLNGGASNFVLILCNDDQACRQAEALFTITTSADEQADAQRGAQPSYIFVPSREPLPDWWAYAAAEYVVLARPPSSLSSTQQLSLEGYMRQGGRLVLPESLMGDSSFLAPYRQGAASGKAELIGLGQLYRFAALDSQLASLFGRNNHQPVGPAFWQALPGSGIMKYSRSRLAINFHFPRFAWLLWWLAAYILAVGLLNFTLLNRYDRREWGWATVPAIAILFSIGLYISSSSQRPKSLQLDEVAVYHLDDSSSLAASSIGLRVSTPHHADLTLSAPPGLLWDNPRDMPRDDFGLGISLNNADTNHGWNIQLGPLQQFPLQLSQWSFADFDFLGIRQFPGTVSHPDATHLLNRTGQSFRQAVYLDHDAIYSLGPVPAGALVDLAASPHRRLSPADLAQMTFNYNLDAPPLKGSSLQDLLENNAALASHFSPGNGAFVGIAGGPVPEIDLVDRSFIHKSYALTIVAIKAAAP